MSLTPMMAQYFQIKDQYKDVLLFYRLGDFYEMFFDDAIIASRELELTLTGRDCGLVDRAPMCGVPYHAVDSYISRLIEKGHKVGICEQTSLPIKGSKELVAREIVRIITPGTVTDNASLIEDKNNYLASVYLDLETDCVGVSWVDVTTGEFNHSFIQAPISSKLNDLLSRITPSEIICNNAMFEKSIELSIVKFGSVCPFTSYNDFAFDYENSLNNLKEQITQNSLKLLKEKKLCICSAGALVEYLRETQKRTLSHIKKIDIDDSNQYMIIDSNARKTLELIENTQDKKRRGTLLGLIDNTSTNMGKRMLRKWIVQPSINENLINARLDCCEELGNDLLRDNFSKSLNNIFDIERLVGKLSFESIMPKECVGLANSLLELPKLKIILDSCKTELLKEEINNQINNFDELTNLIFSAIHDKATNSLKDGKIIKEGFDQQLDNYNNMKDYSVQAIANLEMEEKEETGIKNLKISFNKFFGYYIEVPKSQVELVPYRYVRKQTVSSGERYIIPELKEIETKVLNAKELAAAKEQELYKLLLDEMKKFMDDLLSTSKAVATLDCLVSNAISAKVYNFVKPIINKEIKHIKIVEGRHCVVENLLKNETFVPNDTLLDENENKIMIITGPNMAGKSVYMRQVAIITILAHIGSFVPAKSAEIAITDRIFTRVGASDDLSTGRSTFMVEMTEVSDILENATPSSLVLLDEIGRGTSTYDGLSIAWAIVEYLSKNLTSKILFSTHYHELTDLEGVLPGLKNYKLSIREVNNSIIFLRKLLRGSANRSYGIEVASLAGLSKEIITRSKEILKLLETSDIGRQTTISSSPQISFFNSNINNEIVAILKDLVLDDISPRAALEILSDLKEKVDIENE